MTDHAKRFAADCGIALSAEFVPFSKSRNAGEEYPSLNWRVTLSKGAQSLTLDYMQGCAHVPHYSHAFARLAVYDAAVREACETGKSRLQPGKKNGYDACMGFRPAKPIPAPSLDEVLYCLVSDASVLDHPSFESWASECGYATDSRKAETIYRQCLAHALALRQMLDLDAAREAFQDY